MSFTGDYKCSKCGTPQKPEMLVAKKVMFQEIGIRPQVYKSRITHWLCAQCVAKDEDWNLPPYSSPGMRYDEGQSNAKA